MEARIRRAAIAFALVFSVVVVDAGGGSSESCRRLSAVESILVPPETCHLLDDVTEVDLGFVGVVEGDEIVLQKATSIVMTNRYQYVALLFYASWCPFSNSFLPNFNSMASLYPSIPHFAFEESLIRPSILSRYGVHGFPTLFMLHSSIRVRYHGSRSIASLTAFYSNVTGMKATTTSMHTKSMKKIIFVGNLSLLEQENCPFSWARSPEKLLQQDTYLTLASSFLILRLLYFLLPKFITCFDKIWTSKKISMWDHSQAFLHRAKRGYRRMNLSNRSNLQEGAINAKANKAWLK